LNGNSGGCGLAEFNCADFMPERASVKPFRPACRNCGASPSCRHQSAAFTPHSCSSFHRSR
jgi:hypothetical protein